MKKWLIGIGIVGALIAVLLAASAVTFALAQGITPSAPAQGTTITPEEAEAAVLAAYPGSTVVEVELELGNGMLAYEVELDNGLEVLVDPSDGTLLGQDAEDVDGALDD